jgi:hypothetical protein
MEAYSSTCRCVAARRSSTNATHSSSTPSNPPLGLLVVAGVVASGAVVIVVWIVVPVVVVVAAKSMLGVGALEIPGSLAGGAVVLVATSGNEEFADSIVGAPHPVSTKVTQTTAATANGVRCPVFRCHRRCIGPAAANP